MMASARVRTSVNIDQNMTRLRHDAHQYQETHQPQEAHQPQKEGTVSLTAYSQVKDVQKETRATTKGELTWIHS
jgi:hypothetical protein